MSFWTKIGVKITDLTCFKESCRQHGIRFEENQDEKFHMQGFKVHATLHDEKGYSKGYLVESGGAFKMVVDNDRQYSTITKRLGANGGKLCRDYTKSVVSKGVRANGGFINSVTENPDGSVLMRVSAM